MDAADRRWPALQVRTLAGTGGHMAAIARLQVRVDPGTKALLERAASLLNVPVSAFVRTAAVDRADHVLREHDAQTTVPASFFDDLLEAVDGPAQPIEALARTGEQSGRVVTG